MAGVTRPACLSAGPQCQSGAGKVLLRNVREVQRVWIGLFDRAPLAQATKVPVDVPAPVRAPLHLGFFDGLLPAIFHISAVGNR